MKHRWAEVKRRYRLGFTMREIARGLKTPIELIRLDLNDMRELGMLPKRPRELAKGKR